MSAGAADGGRSTALLAIDTARSSGWCIRADGIYVASGQCDAYGPEPRELCRRVLKLDPKAYLVLERAFGGTLTTVQGLGAARGCWLSAWREATGGKTLVRCVSTYPQQWRSQLFRCGAGFALQERLHAQVVSRKTNLGSDEAAAVCIASWAETQMPARSKAAPKARSSAADQSPKRSART